MVEMLNTIVGWALSLLLVGGVVVWCVNLLTVPLRKDGRGLFY